MTCELTLDGNLSVGGANCGCDGDGFSSTVRGLSLSCSSSSFQAIKSTDCAIDFSTTGLIGQNWKELPLSLATYELLSLKASAPVRLRIGAAAAELEGDAVAFPVTTIDAQSFVFEVDGQEVSVTFSGVSLSAVQIAQQINAAAVADGLTFLPASVHSSGTKLVLTGQETGSEALIEVTTGLVAIGFAVNDAATGAGEELDVKGAFLVQFATPPSRIQISGAAKLEILAAGTP